MKRPYETVVVVNGMLSENEIDGVVKEIEDYLQKMRR